MGKPAVTIRPAVAEDMAAIRELHGDIELALGKEMDLPELFTAQGEQNPHILVLYVVEEDGQITGGYYAEKAVEMCFFGLNPRATAVARQHQEALFQASRNAGVRFIHCQVPHDFPSVGKHLEDSGFEDVGPKYRHFVKDLR